jgi:hypothetical protein
MRPPELLRGKMVVRCADFDARHVLLDLKALVRSISDRPVFGAAVAYRVDDYSFDGLRAVAPAGAGGTMLLSMPGVFGSTPDQLRNVAAEIVANDYREVVLVNGRVVLHGPTLSHGRPPITRFALSRRHADWSLDDLADHWLRRHAPLVVQGPLFDRSTINIAETPSAWDGVVEQRFTTREHLLEHDRRIRNDKPVAADVKRFVESAEMCFGPEVAFLAARGDG